MVPPRPPYVVAVATWEKKREKKRVLGVRIEKGDGITPLFDSVGLSFHEGNMGKEMEEGWGAAEKKIDGEKWGAGRGRKKKETLQSYCNTLYFIRT